METPLRLKIKSLPFGVHEIACHLDEAFFTEEEPVEVRQANVDVSVKVTRHDERVYHLKLSCCGTLMIPCDRCLDDMEHVVDVSYELDVKQDGNSLDDSNDGLLIIPESWTELDVAPLVRDTVLLTVPLVHNHASENDCNAGMLDRLDAYQSGTASENPSHDAMVDPRWDALRKLSEQE